MVWMAVVEDIYQITQIVTPASWLVAISATWFLRSNGSYIFHTVDIAAELNEVQWDCGSAIIWDLSLSPMQAPPA